jgi:hypothetical protein
VLYIPRKRPLTPQTTRCFIAELVPMCAFCGAYITDFLRSGQEVTVRLYSCVRLDHGHNNLHLPATCLMQDGSFRSTHSQVMRFRRALLIRHQPCVHVASSCEQVFLSEPTPCLQQQVGKNFTFPVVIFPPRCPPVSRSRYGNATL